MIVHVSSYILLLCQFFHKVPHSGRNSETAVPSTTTVRSPNTTLGPNTAGQGPATAAAAAVVMVIIAAILATVIGIIVILVILRRRAKRSGTAVICNNGDKVSLKELDNPIYSGKH